MGRLIILFALCVAGIVSNGQDTVLSVRKITSGQGSITDFTVDHMGSLYLVLDNARLKKLDIKGDSVSVFNDIRRFGRITSVDAVNPFTVLLFFRESSTIVVLDRLLSVRNVIDLRKAGILRAKAIRLSYDNNIWVFDELSNKISKVDQKGKIVFESADLRVVFPRPPSFSAIFENYGYLYLYDQQQGWFVFDYYGSFVKKHAFVNWRDAQVSDGKMLGWTDSLTVTARVGDFDFKSAVARFPVAGIVKMQQRVVHDVTSNTFTHYYVLYPGRLEVYEVVKFH